MAAIRTKVKSWGNSLGIVIPKEEAKKQIIRKGDEVLIEIKKPKEEIMKLFGSLKLKKSSQELKDEAKKGWM